MAKKKDPFETFRAATLGGSSPFDQALKPKADPVVDNDPRRPVRPQDSTPAVQTTVAATDKKGKNAGRELVSFHIDRDMKRQLGFVKFDTGKSFNELYIEAIEDLLRKYGKL